MHIMCKTLHEVCMRSYYKESLFEFSKLSIDKLEKIGDMQVLEKVFFGYNLQIIAPC
jgi:hypothetical protein